MAAHGPMSDNPFESLLGGPGLAGLVGSLDAAGLTVATAESLTGGLLAAALTSIPGSSAVVRGGLVVYATDLKHTLAGVDAHLLAEHGPVHPDVAAALAAGARDRCAADIGVGLTGVAGPDPQNGVLPGTWYVAVTGPRGVRSTSNEGASDPDRPVRGGTPVALRHRIRVAAVAAALRLLTQTLDAETSSPRTPTTPGGDPRGTPSADRAFN